VAVQIEQLDVVPDAVREAAPARGVDASPRPQHADPQREHEIALTVARLRARELRLHAD
jgi:hypothetical protein